MIRLPDILNLKLLLLFCSTFFSALFAEESFVFVRSNVVSGCSDICKAEEVATDFYSEIGILHNHESSSEIHVLKQFNNSVIRDLSLSFDAERLVFSVWDWVTIYTRYPFSPTATASRSAEPSEARHRFGITLATRAF
jgi:hypothetical protein